MYLKHHGLSRQPFKLSSDPDFLWTGEKQKAALEALKEGILENRGFVLLTGEVGTGKTTLVNAFPKLNEIATITVTIPDPGMDPLDFCNFLASEFKMNRKFASKDDFVRDFKGFLLRSFATYKKVLVIIDEAQRLDYAMLEEVRQLAAIEMAGRRLLKIFFVGQPEFCDMLMDERGAAVRDFIVAAYNIEPLDVSETTEYIIHRIAVAGSKQELFTYGALMRVYVLTGGYPRTINVLCDHCLLRGYSTDLNLIDADTVTVCANFLGLRPMAQRPRDYVFPFQMRKIENEEIHRPGRSRKKLFTALIAAFLGVICILAGYLAFRWGVHASIFEFILNLK
jgi:general secretion pathway protein A